MIDLVKELPNQKVYLFRLIYNTDLSISVLSPFLILLYCYWTDIRRRAEIGTAFTKCMYPLSCISTIGVAPIVGSVPIAVVQVSLYTS